MVKMRVRGFDHSLAFWKLLGAPLSKTYTHIYRSLSSSTRRALATRCEQSGFNPQPGHTCWEEYKLLGFKDRRELNRFNTPQTKVCMKVVAALRATYTRCTAPLPWSCGTGWWDLLCDWHDRVWKTHKKYSILMLEFSSITAVTLMLDFMSEVYLYI